MAKRKYFTSYDEMIVGIRADLADKFDLVCDTLCEELNDLLAHYVYEIKTPDVYDRTYEMANEHIVKYKKKGKLNAEFYFDDKLITEIDNPHHHILEEDGTMEELVDLAT